MAFSEQDIFYMKEALKEAALAAEADEVPVGAIIVKDGQIIGRGRNERETKKDPTCHAEMSAIREAAATLGGWRIGGTLYVTLEPCPMCAGAMVMARVGKCVYGAEDLEKGCCGSVDCG